MENVNEALTLIAKTKAIISTIQVEDCAQAEDLSYACQYLQEAIDKLTTK